MTRVLLCFVLLVCVLLCFINPILVAIEMPWKGGLGTVKKSAKPRNFEVENSHGIVTAHTRPRNVVPNQTDAEVPWNDASIIGSRQLSVRGRFSQQQLHQQ